jgi:hypothetical protein
VLSSPRCRKGQRKPVYPRLRGFRRTKCRTVKWSKRSHLSVPHPKTMAIRDRTKGCGPQKLHRPTNDAFGSRIDVPIIDRCRSERSQIRFLPATDKGAPDIDTRREFLLPFRASQCRQTVPPMVKKLIFASKEGKFTRPKAHAASRS